MIEKATSKWKQTVYYVLVIGVTLSVSSYLVLETRKSLTVIFDAENLPFSLKKKKNRIDKVNYNLLRQTWKESAWTNLISNIVTGFSTHHCVWCVCVYAACGVCSSTARFNFSLPLLSCWIIFQIHCYLEFLNWKLDFFIKRKTVSVGAVLYAIPWISQSVWNIKHWGSDIRRVYHWATKCVFSSMKPNKCNNSMNM